MCQCQGATEHQHGLGNIQTSLHPYIDFANAICLNAVNSTKINHVLRPRFSDPQAAEIQSDLDDQLLVKIP